MPSNQQRPAFQPEGHAGQDQKIGRRGEPCKGRRALLSVENQASCCFWSIGFRNFFQLLNLEPRRITFVVQKQAIDSAVSANREPGRQRQLLGGPCLEPAAVLSRWCGQDPLGRRYLPQPDLPGPLRALLLGDGAGAGVQRALAEAAGRACRRRKADHALLDMNPASSMAVAAVNRLVGPRQDPPHQRRELPPQQGRPDGATCGHGLIRRRDRASRTRQPPPAPGREC